MSARVTIPAYYDFASTICFVAHRVLERMRDDLEAMGADVEWRPLDLVGITGWRRGTVVEGPRRDNALRVAGELGVSVRMPPVWLDSRPAHAIALAIADEPKEAAWRERVWSAVFEEGRDIGEEAELGCLASDLGLDLESFGPRRDFSVLEVNTAAARQADVTGVPTFDLGFPLGGIQDPQTMKLLFQRWVDRNRRRPDASA